MGSIGHNDVSIGCGFVEFRLLGPVEGEVVGRSRPRLCQQLVSSRCQVPWPGLTGCGSGSYHGWSGGQRAVLVRRLGLTRRRGPDRKTEEFDGERHDEGAVTSVAAACPMPITWIEMRA